MDVTLEKLILSAEGVRRDLLALISQAKGQSTCVQEFSCPFIPIHSQTIELWFDFFVCRERMYHNHYGCW